MPDRLKISLGDGCQLRFPRSAPPGEVVVAVVVRVMVVIMVVGIVVVVVVYLKGGTRQAVSLPLLHALPSFLAGTL
jgi:hypothetical protein